MCTVLLSELTLVSSQVLSHIFQIFQFYSECCYLTVIKKITCEKQTTNSVLQKIKELKANKNFNQVLIIISPFLLLLQLMVSPSWARRGLHPSWLWEPRAPVPNEWAFRSPGWAWTPVRIQAGKAGFGLTTFDHTAPPSEEVWTALGEVRMETQAPAKPWPPLGTAEGLCSGSSAPGAPREDPAGFSHNCQGRQSHSVPTSSELLTAPSLPAEEATGGL